MDAVLGIIKQMIEEERAAKRASISHPAYRKLSVMNINHLIMPF